MVRKWPEPTLDELWHTMPVCIWELARYYGFEVHWWPLPDRVSAVLYEFDGCSYVYINQSHPMRRQRFTMAHELAHHLVGDLDRRNERLADKVAATILMPKMEVHKCLGEGMPFPAMLKHFGVSQAAMRFRLDEIGREEREWARKVVEVRYEQALAAGSGE